MTLRTILAATILVTGTAAALAQTAKPATTGGVLIIPAKDIAKRLDVPPAKPGAAVSSPITTTGSYRTMVAHRTADGVPEQHAHWIDVMVVLQGDVTLTFGGNLSGNTVDADGESHDGKITGGTSVALHKGDYIQVPAGLPHLMTAPKGDFRYFVTKIHA
jgi:mannose-6-phosphate isomerase-like protein (cupin superfamily)